jgi:hypothetical protein
VLIPHTRKASITQAVRPGVEPGLAA